MENIGFAGIQPLAAIQPLWDTMPISAAALGESKAEVASLPFADVFQSAIENVKTTDAEKNQAQYLMAVGELDNPAELSIASSKAKMSVDLLVQLRNKALDAYSEVMRISL